MHNTTLAIEIQYFRVFMGNDHVCELLVPIRFGSYQEITCKLLILIDMKFLVITCIKVECNLESKMNHVPVFPVDSVGDMLGRRSSSNASPLK